MLPGLNLPASLAGLLAGLRPCFSWPSFRTFCGLAAGLCGQVRHLATSRTLDTPQNAPHSGMSTGTASTPHRGGTNPALTEQIVSSGIKRASFRDVANPGCFRNVHTTVTSLRFSLSRYWCSRG